MESNSSRALSGNAPSRPRDALDATDVVNARLAASTSGPSVMTAQ